MESGHEHGGRIFALAEQLGVVPEDILDFSASINPLGPAPGVRPAIESAIGRLGHYPEIGSPRLRAALAGYHGLPADRIAVANGSTELIHMLPRLWPAPGRALLIAPAFAEYAHALENAGWELDRLCLAPENGFAIDLYRTADELAKGYELLFCCNPGNPTGRLYRSDEMLALYELCRQNGCVLVLDEAFIDFCEEHSLKRLLPADGDWLILRSMTKFFGFPGLRVGYSVAPATLTARLQRLLPPWNVGTLAEAAALAALADIEHGRRIRDYVAGEREIMIGRLGAIPGLRVFAGAANYLLVQLASGITASQLEGRLLAERILIRNCANFIGLDERFVRIAVNRREENARLLTALKDRLKL